MLNLKSFTVNQLIHIAAALIGSNRERHTKSSYTITLTEKLQIKSYLRSRPRSTVLPLDQWQILQWKHWNNCVGFSSSFPITQLIQAHTLGYYFFFIGRVLEKVTMVSSRHTGCRSTCLCVALTHAQHNTDGIEESKGLTPNPAKLF